MIITTVLQILLERLDLGKTLPEAIAAPRASQRNSATTRAPSRRSGLTEGQALDGASTAHALRDAPSDGDRRASPAIEFLRPRPLARGREPTRRGGGSAAVVRAASRSPRAPAAGRGRRRRRRPRPPAPRPRTARWRPRRRARSSARAQAMSRGVSPITTVRSRGHAGRRARARDRRQLGPRSSWSEPKPPWPRLEVVRRCRRAASLSRATGSRLPVTSESRKSSGRAASASSSSTIPGATRVGQVGRAQPLVGLDGRGLRPRPARVDRLARHAGAPPAGRARSRASVRPAYSTRAPSSVDAVHRARPPRAAPRACSTRGPLQQRAVDVEEQQERLSA